MPSGESRSRRRARGRARRGADRSRSNVETTAPPGPARGIRETEQRQRVADAIGVDEHDRGAQQDAEGDRDEDRRIDRAASERPAGLQARSGCRETGAPRCASGRLQQPPDVRGCHRQNRRRAVACPRRLLRLRSRPVLGGRRRGSRRREGRARAEPRHLRHRRGSGEAGADRGAAFQAPAVCHCSGVREAGGADRGWPAVAPGLHLISSCPAADRRDAVLDGSHRYPVDVFFGSDCPRSTRSDRREACA